MPDQNWLKKISEQIHGYEKSLSKKDYKKYKLELVEKLSKKADQFSNQCGECYQFRGEIENLLNNLSGLVQISPTAGQNYQKKTNSFLSHLRKKHKLIKAGTYLAIGNAAGAALGVSIGMAMGNIAAGIGIGIGAGAAVGSALEAKAKKDGRLI